MKLITLLDDTIKFIFRRGGQSDLTLEARERSNSKCRRRAYYLSWDNFAVFCDPANWSCFMVWTNS